MSAPAPFGPELFRPDAISPEIAAFNADIEARVAVGQPLPRATDVAAMATERQIPGPSGEVGIRVIVPEVVRGVYMYMHGGQWVGGSASGADGRNERLARNAQVAVVSVDYRLAPDHPYPAAPDDCEAVALWLAQHARAEFGAERLVIGGESAGGQLAAVTLVRLRTRHGAMPFAGAVLNYGAFDLAGTPSLRNWGERRLPLNPAWMRQATDMFAPPEIQLDPDVSPLYADLSGMPPALFTQGTVDPYLDDGLFMYMRWVAAGNEAELAVYPGGIHTFLNYATELSQAALARIQRFVTHAVSG